MSAGYGRLEATAAGRGMTWEARAAYSDFFSPRPRRTLLVDDIHQRLRSAAGEHAFWPKSGYDSIWRALHYWLEHDKGNRLRCGSIGTVNACGIQNGIGKEL